MVPQYLELLSTHETGGFCCSALFNKNGKLLIGCHDGIRVYSEDFNNAEHILKARHVTSIANSYTRTEFVFIEHHLDERIAGMTSSDFSGQY